MKEEIEKIIIEYAHENICTDETVNAIMELVEREKDKVELETWVWIKENLVDEDSDYYGTVMANIKSLTKEKNELGKESRQCFCQSYYDDDNKLQDCTCGKCF